MRDTNYSQSWMLTRGLGICKQLVSYVAPAVLFRLIVKVRPVNKVKVTERDKDKENIS